METGWHWERLLNRQIKNGTTIEYWRITCLNEYWKNNVTVKVHFFIEIYVYCDFSKQSNWKWNSSIFNGCLEQNINIYKMNRRKHLSIMQSNFILIFELFNNVFLKISS